MDVGTVYEINDAARFKGSFVDFDGNPGAPTMVVCLVKDPDGNVTTYTYGGSPSDITAGNIGDYYVDVELTKTGEWFYRFEGTGAIQKSGEGSVVVRCSEVI